jgi:hypothetical protein
VVFIIKNGLTRVPMLSQPQAVAEFIASPAASIDG